MTTLSNQAKSLWAKKENRDGQELWLPLVAHLIDAQNVIHWLYNNWLNESQKSVLRKNISYDDTQKLVKFIGFFHDIGKATPAFQTKPSYNRDSQLDDELMEKLLRNGFTKLDDYDPSSRRRSPHAIAGETLLEKFGLNESIGSIIGAHHGKPAEEFFDYEDQIYDYTSNYFQSDNDAIVQGNWEKVHKELITYGLNKSGYDQLQNIPEINQKQAVLLTGLLIMADWIASSEFLNNDHSQPMFPLIRLDQSFDDIDLKRRYKNAIETWDISGHWTPMPVPNIDEHY